MKSLFSILLVLGCWNEIKGQELDSFACNVVNIFKQKDSSGFFALTIQPADNAFIIEKKLGMSPGSVDLSVQATDTQLVRFKKELAHAFLLLHKSAVEKGLNWAELSCDVSMFEKEFFEEDGITLANGSILLFSMSKKFKLLLPRMIKIKDTWRLTSVDIVEVK
jgi:hypothetical protein